MKLINPNCAIYVCCHTHIYSSSLLWPGGAIQAATSEKELAKIVKSASSSLQAVIMRNLYPGEVVETPTLPLPDLKVTIQSTSLVFPTQESGDVESKSVFLSNIDQVLNFDVQTVHFFASHPDFPPQKVAEKIKIALEKLLVPYDFLAGRLKVNPDTGRLEFACNRAGAGFVVASTESKLDEIGDLVYPNPAFEHLVTKTMDNLRKDDQPLCLLQVTSFKCGGFAMGTSTNHATFDGLSFKTFLDNLASVAADRPLAVIPCNDRQLLAARSPPRVTFPHPELLKLDNKENIINTDHSKTAQEQEEVESSTSTRAAPGVFDATQEALDFKILRLSSRDISALKDKAKSAHAECSPRISGFNVVTALIWRCKALSHSCRRSRGGGDDHDRDANKVNYYSKNADDDDDLEDRVSTILYAVNIRPRMIPPLPASYAGNAVLTAYASAKCGELREGPFSRLVEMVGEGATRMTDEYARSVIDWGEMHKGFPHGELLVSSWWKLGFEQVDYPWGRPRYSCPVVYRRKDIILLFPDIHDPSAVNVLVALPTHEMPLFQSLFHSFLYNN